MEIRAAALRTLTAIIHLDRNPNFIKLNTIIDVTGAALYHGFLPVLVRSCIGSLTGQQSTEQQMTPFPLPLATALFSFLYHLASYEAGGEALVACGMMESLLRVVSWPGSELEHITFVTRAVRVIDLITNLDMHAFQVRILFIGYIRNFFFVSLFFCVGRLVCGFSFFFTVFSPNRRTEVCRSSSTGSSRKLRLAAKNSRMKFVRHPALPTVRLPARPPMTSRRPALTSLNPSRWMWIRRLPRPRPVIRCPTRRNQWPASPACPSEQLC